MACSTREREEVGEQLGYIKSTRQNGARWLFFGCCNALRCEKSETKKTTLRG